MAPSSEVAAAATSNNVYVQDEVHGWVPARLLSTSKDGETTATVRICPYEDDVPPAALDDGDDENAAEAPLPSHQSLPAGAEVVVDLRDYPPSNSLPLQNVDEEGNLVEVDDMVDLSFLHEAAILYNLRARHVRGVPYTRTGDIVIAVNPYHWIEGLYSAETQEIYADRLIWDRDDAARSGGGSGSGGSSPSDPRSAVDPHVYETSSLAYRGLACDAQNQSVLVSGESGAGKTETVKILMNHLAAVQNGADGGGGGRGRGGACSSPPEEGGGDMDNTIIKRVLDSNPLLEAFGNAKTARNDNSSRFGKYIELQFDCESPREAALRGNPVPSCVLAGSRCVTYLLEKSRVVLHESRAERGYHVFYQLLASPREYREGLWPPLAGRGPEDFKYLGRNSTKMIEGKTDGQRWTKTVDALRTVGIEDGGTLDSLMGAMCTVLQLGNLSFEPDPANEEAAVITNRDELELLAELMGTGTEDVERALTVRTVTAKREVYKVPLNDHAAKDCCDAFAKEVYARAFDWLVREINQATSAELNYSVDPSTRGAGFDAQQRPGKFGIIGLLDIFGFESFEVNRFEQLCINYANEKLQQKFTQDIFRSVQAEYEFEGIELGEVTFEDNADVLKLVEGRMGLISVLNEECVRPRGNDTAFVSKVNAMNKESDILVKDNFFREYEFGIQHYAGVVVYDATNFVKKNTDSLPGDLQDLAKKCSNELIRTELLRKQEELPSSPAPTAKGGGGGSRRALVRKQSSGSLISQTVSTKFRSQLQALMANIGETRSRYIRCIKPNMEKAPRKMEHVSTIAQLRCAGVVAAVTISRSAFPNRLEHEVTLERFMCLPTRGLSPSSMSKDEGMGEAAATSRERVDSMLTVLLRNLETKKADGATQKAFVCGKTRVYFRAGSLEYLESRRLTALSDRAVEMQRATRRFLARSKYVTMKEAAVTLQSHARGVFMRMLFTSFRVACITVQCWARCNMAKAELVRRREEAKAAMLQTHWRMAVAMARLSRCRHAAVAIQAMTRGAHQRPVYRKMLADAIEEAKVENQLKTLQRKLEEAEARRIEAEKKAAAGAAPQTVVVYRDSEGGEEKKNEGQLNAQQQTLIDESGKMLEYLRKEVFKLRSQNGQLRKDFDLLRENNQRLMDSNASAGASFAALNQHAKQLNMTNAKLMSELQAQKQHVSKLHLAQMELKEELKMKQSTYISEVQSRLMYQKTMMRMVDLIQSRCTDESLVEDIAAMTEACELDYMNGPTGRSSPQTPAVSSIFSRGSPSSPDRRTPGPNDSSISGRFMSFFGMSSPSPPQTPKQGKPAAAKKLEMFSGNFTEV